MNRGMAENEELTDWALPASLRPQPEQLQFDLERAFRSMVLVHADAPEDAFTASILGTERIGHGAVINSDGLILTIGYLITEAQSIWLTTHEGRVTAGHALAYDQVTGFGLVLPLGRLEAPPFERGSTSSLSVGDETVVIGHGGIEHALSAQIIAKREFAGYWEYLLDEAIFASPAHPQWGGTALLGNDGRLLGIGSLMVQAEAAGRSIDANMFVPIDLLEPILDDMIKLGQPARTPRPWLGMYTTETNGQIVISGLVQNGPAHRAGVKLGDVVLKVADQQVSRLAGMFRSIWNIGPAGTEIPMTLARSKKTTQVRVRSADRNDYLTKPRHH
jgi:S1-C subfamily serine protease